MIEQAKEVAQRLRDMGLEGLAETVDALETKT